MKNLIIKLYTIIINYFKIFSSKCEEKFESPFTWDIDEKFVTDFDVENELSDPEEIPFLTLMNAIMKTYIYAVKVDYNNAIKSVRKTEEIWNNLDQTKIKEEGISINVIFNIMQSTKYYAYKEIENYIEAKTVLNTIEHLSNIDNLQNSSTLYGCKSVAWSVFHESAMEKAILFARLAIDVNPNCSMWYFILAKNLRRYRRNYSICTRPCKEEIDSLLKSYNLSQNPLYGIYLALTYAEDYDYTTSRHFNKEVYDMNSKNYKIHLRLALNFIRQWDLDNAKKCLDYVETINPESNMFLHYKGMYYMKNNNHEEAIKYLKKAADSTNFAANLQYGLCLKKIDEDFSYLCHLLFMLKKFQDNYVVQQHILLHLGMEYYNDKNYKKALQYFIRAIKLLPKSQTLKVFFYTSNTDPYNIFDFVEEYIIFYYKYNSSLISIDVKVLIEEFENFQNQLNVLEVSLTQNKILNYVSLCNII